MKPSIPLLISEYPFNVFCTKIRDDENTTILITSQDNESRFPAINVKKFTIVYTPDKSVEKDITVNSKHKPMHRINLNPKTKMHTEKNSFLAGNFMTS